LPQQKKTKRFQNDKGPLLFFLSFFPSRKGTNLPQQKKIKRFQNDKGALLFFLSFFPSRVQGEKTSKRKTSQNKKEKFFILAGHSMSKLRSSKKKRFRRTN